MIKKLLCVLSTVSVLTACSSTKLEDVSVTSSTISNVADSAKVMVAEGTEAEAISEKTSQELEKEITAQLEKELDELKQQKMAEVETAIDDYRKEKLAEVEKAVEDFRSQKLEDAEKTIDQYKKQKMADVEAFLAEYKTKKMAEMTVAKDQTQKKAQDVVDKLAGNDLSKTAEKLEK